MMYALFFPMLMLLAACQASGIGLTSPAQERIVAQFDATVFSPEFAAKRELPLRRWSSPPVLGAGGDSDKYLEFVPEIAAVGEQLAAIAPVLHWRPRSATLAPTLYIAVVPRSAMEDAVSGPVAFRHIYGGSQCLVVTYSHPKTGEIFRAGIVIDRDLSPHIIRHCIAEEMVQAMGLLGDACHYRPSLFCDYDEELAMTNADRVLLRTLYDPRLKPGMTREEAMPIAREIIRELWRD